MESFLFFIMIVSAIGTVASILWFLGTVFDSDSKMMFISLATFLICLGLLIFIPLTDSNRAASHDVITTEYGAVSSINNDSIVIGSKLYKREGNKSAFNKRFIEKYGNVSFSKISVGELAEIRYISTPFGAHIVSIRKVSVQ